MICPGTLPHPQGEPIGAGATWHTPKRVPQALPQFGGGKTILPESTRPGGAVHVHMEPTGAGPVVQIPNCVSQKLLKGACAMASAGISINAPRRMTRRSLCFNLTMLPSIIGLFALFIARTVFGNADSGRNRKCDGPLARPHAHRALNLRRALDLLT
jgi:hypothetical protein